MLSRHLHLHLMFCVSHLESIWYKLYPNHIVPPPPLDLDLVLELRWNFFGGQRLHAKNYITWFIGQILVGALVIDEPFIDFSFTQSFSWLQHWGTMVSSLKVMFMVCSNDQEFHQVLPTSIDFLLHLNLGCHYTQFVKNDHLSG